MSVWAFRPDCFAIGGTQLNPVAVGMNAFDVDSFFFSPQLELQFRASSSHAFTH